MTVFELNWTNNPFHCQFVLAESNADSNIAEMLGSSKNTMKKQTNKHFPHFSYPFFLCSRDVF